MSKLMSKLVLNLSDRRVEPKRWGKMLKMLKMIRVAEQDAQIKMLK